MERVSLLLRTAKLTANFFLSKIKEIFFNFKFPFFVNQEGELLNFLRP